MIHKVGVSRHEPSPVSYFLKTTIPQSPSHAQLLRSVVSCVLLTATYIMHPLQYVYRIVKGKWVPPKNTKPDLTGRTIIITGANTGVGFEAAVKLVACGAQKVILAVRTLSKGEDAARKIIERTGRKGVVEVWELDMLDYSSVKAFAKRAETQLDRLDTAILNAGVVKLRFQSSKYGWEETMQVNVLSTTLLALLLMPKLKASKTDSYTPVLEIIGSGNQYMVKSLHSETTPLASYNEAANFSGPVHYSVSKLFVMYAQHYLTQLANATPSARPGTHVTVVCPGATKSDLGRDADAWYMKLAMSIFSFLMQKTTEEGSREYVSGIDLGEKGHGKFWTEDRIAWPAPLMEGEKGKVLQERVW